jgi:hypothetical protein
VGEDNIEVQVIMLQKITFVYHLEKIECTAGKRNTIVNQYQRDVYFKSEEKSFRSAGVFG